MSDPDGLGLIEIQERDEAGKIVARLTMPPAQAKLLIEVLQKKLEDENGN